MPLVDEPIVQPVRGLDALPPRPVVNGLSLFPARIGNDPKVKLLLDLDGNLIDRSGNGHIPALVGNAVLSTDYSRFGKYSLYIPDVNAALTIPHSTDFQTGEGDFTFACWLYPVATSSYNRIVCAFCRDYAGYRSFMVGQTTTQNIVMWAGSGGSWSLINGASNTFGTNATTINYKTWSHFAVVRWGRKMLTFYNGNLASCYAFAPTSNVEFQERESPYHTLTIGNNRDTSDNYTLGFHDCYFSDVYYVKGRAEWISSFVPPSRPMPYVAYCAYDENGLLHRFTQEVVL